MSAPFGPNYPPLVAFLAQLGSERALAQVQIRRIGEGFELRHIADSEAPAESLRQLPLAEAPGWAQTNSTGQFRPLKSAPDLRQGWRLTVANGEELAAALNHFYPGALADWFSARGADPPVTNYRDYTGRQSGMYRVTAMLTDSQAAKVLGEVCDRSRCLKRRLWTVAGVPPDSPESKSLIPCLEPCAILLESARVAFRASQQEKGGESKEKM